jgi:hypothetical protein
MKIRLNCKVVDVVKHYNICLRCPSIQGCLRSLKNKILKKIMNFQNFNTLVGEKFLSKVLK